MTIIAEHVATLEVGNTLGEGILWRDSDRTLWWTDIQSCLLYCLDWDGQDLKTFPTPERLCSFAFLEGRDDIILAAFESGFAFFRPQDGEHVWLDRPSELCAGIRLNDGRVDAAGRFWAGSITEGEMAEAHPYGGALYCLGLDGKATRVTDGIGISNSICWSPDATVMYFSDSRAGEFRAAPFDPVSGLTGPFRTRASFSDANPDGAVVDANGNIWIAMWGWGEVLCLSPEATELGRVAVPAPHATCPVIGGVEGNLLFVASARLDLSPQQLQDYPQSGSVFIYRINCKGSPVLRARVKVAAPF